MGLNDVGDGIEGLKAQQGSNMETRGQVVRTSTKRR